MLVYVTTCIGLFVVAFLWLTGSKSVRTTIELAVAIAAGAILLLAILATAVIIGRQRAGMMEGTVFERWTIRAGLKQATWTLLGFGFSTAFVYWRHRQFTAYMISLYLAFAVIGVAASIYFHRAQVRRIREGRRMRAMCERCGYSVADTLSRVCPECGHDSAPRFAERTPGENR